MPDIWAERKLGKEIELVDMGEGPKGELVFGLSLTDQGSVSRKPRKRFGPEKPF